MGLFNTLYALWVETNRMSLKRQIKRKKEKKAKKKLAKEVKEQVGLFKLLPDACTVCEAPFDKKDREYYMTWRVAVNEEHRKVALVCPTCQEKHNEASDGE